MTLRTRLALLAAVAVAVAAPFSATAHRQWIVPSATVLSGDDPWVTFDAAVSNELFYADHNPLRLDNLSVQLPDGTFSAPENIATGKYRSVFDLHLTQPGTYKVFTAGDMASASYELNGEKKRWRGKKDEIGTAIPEGATNVELSEGQNRLEVFVTRGAPTDSVFKPTNLGFEMVPVTHPNDLFVGEVATFKLLLDGQPAKGVEVTYLPGGSRYRNGTGEAKVTTGDDGGFQITFPEAGMFWLNASQQDLPSTIEGAKRRVGYTTVLEVLNP